MPIPTFTHPGSPGTHHRWRLTPVRSGTTTRVPSGMPPGQVEGSPLEVSAGWLGNHHTVTSVSSVVTHPSWPTGVNSNSHVDPGV